MPSERELLSTSEVEPTDDELSRILAMVDAMRFAEPAVYVFHARPMLPREAVRAQAKIREANP